MDHENAPFFTQEARSRISFDTANGARRAGQKSLPALCNLLPCKTELSMKGILEVDILGKVSYTKIIANASIAATRAETAGGDAQTAK